jgi:hypothetical protein
LCGFGVIFFIDVHFVYLCARVLEVGFPFVLVFFGTRFLFVLYIVFLFFILANVCWFIFDKMFVGIWRVLVVEYSAQIVIYIEKT